MSRVWAVAKDIAGRAGFFSFGTNDLIQTFCGLSCDDAEGRFLAQYLEEGILQKHPFETSTGAGSAGSGGWPAKGGSRPIPISSWTSAASTAATPRASTFPKRWASTTSPAHPTECRSPVSPPRKQRLTVHFPPPMVSRKMRQARSGGIVLARKPSQGNRR